MLDKENSLLKEKLQEKLQNNKSDSKDPQYEQKIILLEKLLE
jgi:hypothetical protein